MTAGSEKNLIKLPHADVSENGHLHDCGVILAHIPGRFPDAHFPDGLVSQLHWNQFRFVNCSYCSEVSRLLEMLDPAQSQLPVIPQTGYCLLCDISPSAPTSITTAQRYKET